MGVHLLWPRPRPCQRCGGFLCGRSEHTPFGGECLVERLAVDVEAAAVAHDSEPSAVDAAADCLRRRAEVLGGLLDGEPAGGRLGVGGSRGGELLAERVENRAGEVRADERLEPGGGCHRGPDTGGHMLAPGHDLGASPPSPGSRVTL